MTFERVEPPHYYAGLMAVWGPWKPITPGRMCYDAGYRYYRNGITSTSKEMSQFSTSRFDVRHP